MQGVWYYYNNLFSPNSPSMVPQCLQVFPKSVSAEMNEALLVPISLEEVKKAIFNLGSLKAPSPDSLNGLFFQKN